MTNGWLGCSTRCLLRRCRREQRELLDALIAKEAARSAEQEPSLPAQPTAAAVPTQRGQRRRRALLGLATAAAALTMFAVVDPLATTGLEDSGTAALAPQDSQASLGTGLTLSPGTPAMLSSGTQYTHADARVPGAGGGGGRRGRQIGRSR